MIDHDMAEEARSHILKAIEHISLSLIIIEGHFDGHTYAIMMRVAGTAIGELDAIYLYHIYKLYPDLDDLK